MSNPLLSGRVFVVFRGHSTCATRTWTELGSGPKEVKYSICTHAEYILRIRRIPCFALKVKSLHLHQNTMTQHKEQYPFHILQGRPLRGTVVQWWSNSTLLKNIRNQQKWRHLAYKCPQILIFNWDGCKMLCKRWWERLSLLISLFIDLFWKERIYLIARKSTIILKIASGFQGTEEPRSWQTRY